MLVYRIEMERMDSHLRDTLWVFANNPHTAKLRAMQWYDWRCKTRKPTYEPLVDTFQVYKHPEKIKPKKWDYVLYEWRLSMYLKHGGPFIILTWGRDVAEAKLFAKKFCHHPFPDELVERTGKCIRGDLCDGKC